MKTQKVLLVAVILVFLLSLIVLLKPWSEYETITKIKIDSYKTLEILSERDWEVTIGIYCRIVNKLENTTTKASIIGFISPNIKMSNLQFGLLKSKDGELIALLENEAPQKILFIYDLNSNQCWSGYGKDNTLELFDKLKMKFPEKTLVRSDQTNDGYI